MQTRITTRHGHINDETQSKVAAKADKLPRFFDRLTAIEVVVDLKDPASARVDINASAEHIRDFVAHAEHENLLSAVEAAVQKMEQQLRRYKERLQGRHRDGASKRSGTSTEPGFEEAEVAE